MPSLLCCAAVCRGMRTARHIIKENCKICVRNELKCKPNSISSPLTTTTLTNFASVTTHSRRMSISCCTCCKSSSRTTRQRRQGGSLKGKDTARCILRLKLQSETSSSRLLEANEVRVRGAACFFLFYPHSGCTHTTHTHTHRGRKGTWETSSSSKYCGSYIRARDIACRYTHTHAHTHTAHTAMARRCTRESRTSSSTSSGASSSTAKD